jgi:TonB family protein
MSTAFASSLLATASLFTASLAFVAPPALAAGCEPKALQNETRFPVRAQLRGHRGTVYVKVRVDEKGRAVGTALHRSSGHRLLDRAAEQSVRRNWVFDVSNCSNEDLQVDRLVAVEYRNEEYGPAGKVAVKKQSIKPSLAAIPAKVSQE